MDSAGDAGHSGLVGSALVRRAETAAFAVLVVTIAGAAFGLALQIRQHPPAEVQLLNNTFQLLASGLVAAVLLARRPDLSFGWIMAAAALTMVVAVTLAAPAAVAFTQGHGSSLKLWAVSLSGIQWVPAVLNGVIYNRFPSGRPVGRLGTLLDRLLLWGTGVMVVVGILTNGPDQFDFVGSTKRIVDQTLIPRLLEPAVIGVPGLILLGGIAGVSVIVRCFRSSGLERKQLLWVAAAAAINLVAFPFAAADVIPVWLGNALLFILPLSVLVPVMEIRILNQAGRLSPVAS